MYIYNSTVDINNMSAYFPSKNLQIVVASSSFYFELYVKGIRIDCADPDINGSNA